MFTNVVTLISAIYFTSFLFKKNFKFISERETDRQSMSEGGEEKEGESEAGSRLRAVSTEPDMGLKLTDCEIMT